MTVCLPATEVISIDAMASVDTVVWRCRLCDHHGTATTRPAAHSEGIEHLSVEHHATTGITANQGAEAHRLHTAGFTFADRLGVSLTTAWRRCRWYERI